VAHTGIQVGPDIILAAVCAGDGRRLEVEHGRVLARLGVVHRPRLRNSRGVLGGRSAFASVSLFLVGVGFQVSNNIAVLAAVETFTNDLDRAGKIAVWLGRNSFIILVRYGFRNLYRPIEKNMLMRLGRAASARKIIASGGRT
jgi:hypothetical protein